MDAEKSYPEKLTSMDDFCYNLNVQLMFIDYRVFCITEIMCDDSDKGGKEYADSTG